MKTYDIFIDFECICGMFARKLNKSFNQIPLSYTIGYCNKQNEIKTIFELFDFNQEIPMNNNFVNYIMDNFAKSIMMNINKLINIKRLIKLDEINFIGWNPCLEEQLLTSIFKKKIGVISLMNNCFEESDLNLKREISLKKLTKNGYADKKYFIAFRKEIVKKISSDSINKLNLNHDGALASFAGFTLYNNMRKTIKSKYHIFMSANVLISELKEYALDDINKMYYFLNNLPEIKKQLKNIKVLDGLKKEINKNTFLINALTEYNPNLKIKDLIKKLETNIEKNKQKTSILED